MGCPRHLFLCFKEMINTILGSKGKMSQTFIQGRRVPVTKITAGPCVVTQIKTDKVDGYWALQLGFGARRIKNVTKPLQGHLKKNIQEKKAPYFLAEVRFEEMPIKKDGSQYTIGDTITFSDIFVLGDIISVWGTSKGKGFAGGVKRWGFAGGPKTHGQSDRQRAPGSIGQGTTPGRVLKGKHMAGRMGGESVTIKNIQIVAIDPEINEIMVSGPIPGISSGNIIITKLAAGKLEGIHEVVAQIVEGEAPVEEGTETSGETKVPEAKAPEVKAPEAPGQVKEETNA